MAMHTCFPPSPQDEDLFNGRAVLLRLEHLQGVSPAAAADASVHDSLNRLLEVPHAESLVPAIVSTGTQTTPVYYDT